MKYVVKVRSPITATIQGEGTWVVEASDRVEAIALLEQSISFWPKGSTWTIKALDAQYQPHSQPNLSRSVLHVPAEGSLVN